MKVDAKWDFTLRNEMATRKGLAQVCMKGHKGRVMFSRLEKRQIGVMTNTTMDSEQERD